MKQTRKTGRKAGSKKIALPNIRPSEYCSVCQLMFGYHERRVFLGDKAVHPHCAPQLAKSIVP